MKVSGAKQTRRSRHWLCAAAILSLVVVSSCTEKSTSGDGDGGSHDLPGGTSGYVTAAAGDTLTTAGGIALQIGAAALPEDTTVELIPVRVEEDDHTFIAGARMEPDGLILDSAVIVRFPLPSNWDPDDTPLVYEFKGDNPDEAVETGAYALVTGGPGAYFAEVLISHFSGVVCAKNCHAGTIRYTLQKFEERGCDADSVLQRARNAYPGVDIPADGCGARGVETVQAFLDTYFEDRGGFNAGSPVSSQLLAELAGYVQSGRQVVLAFKPGTWGARSGAHNFLPTSVTEFAHTAPLEFRNGEVQIRNTLATGDDKLIQALGGENVVRYPLNKLNEFRNLPQGVAVEMALCGSPGCLSDPSKNQYGLDIYHPVEGQGYWGRAWSDPWTYIFSDFGSWSGIPPRSIPWTAVRIYVERLDGPQSELCPEEPGESTLNATVNIPGYAGAFVARFVLAGLGSHNDVPGFPAIEATDDETPSPQDFFDHDYLTLFFDNDLSAPGTFTFTDFGLETGDALLAFTTPQIRDAGTTYNVTFVSYAGSFTLEAYGKTPGDRLKGTFSASVTGDREITPPEAEESEFETINGTISGSFDAEILPSGGTVLRIPIRDHSVLTLGVPQSP